MRRLLLTACSIGLLAGSLTAGLTEASGLLFPHNNGALGSRGRLILPASGTLHADSSFSLAFDLAIWDASVFGYVLTVADASGFSARLTYFPRPGSAHLHLSVNYEPTALAIPLPSQTLGPRAWHSLIIEFDARRQIIALWWDGAKSGEVAVSLPVPMSPAFTFGMIEEVREVPPMSVRDVRFYRRAVVPGGGEPAHQWPLDEMVGAEARDLTGGMVGEQRDCRWIAGRTLHWTLEHREPVELTDRMLFDPVGSRLIRVSGSSMVVQSLSTGTSSRIQTQNPLPGPGIHMKLAHDSYRDKLMAFYNGTGEVSLFLDSAAAWTPITIDKKGTGEYYNHAAFVHPVTGKLHAFGGYGWYTAKNSVLEYNPSTKKWEPVTMVGERLPAPRYLPLVTGGKVAGTWYMTGGVGNRSGRQEAGFYAQRDLWLLDLDRRSWRCLRESLDVPEGWDITGIARPPESDEVFLLFSAARGDSSLYRLVGLRPDSGAIREVGTPLVIDNSFGYAFFGYDEQLGRFTLGMQRADSPTAGVLRMYCISYDHGNPPRPVIASVQPGTAEPLLLALGLMLAVLLYYQIMDMKPRAPTGAADTPVRERLEPNQPKPVVMHLASRARQVQGASVHEFGRLRVIDAAGRDRTGDFSPKLMELFLLALVHSHPDTTKNRGIPTAKLTSYLWPHSIAASAKNSRGVALSSLRSLLAEIGGMQVMHNEGHYALELDPSVSSDYMKYHEILDRFDRGGGFVEPGDLQRVVEILEQGDLLAGLEYSWIGAIRKAVRERLDATFHNISGGFYLGENIELWGRLAKQILERDPLNETALRVALQALSADGEHGRAIDLHRSFMAFYRETFQRDFPRPLKDLLSETR